MAIVVYKLGGSLLEARDLRKRLDDLLQRETRDILFVVGGGRATDVVRHWDATHGLGDDLAHEIAIESMRLTATLVAGLLKRGTVCHSRRAVETAWREGRVPVLSVGEFLREEEPAALAEGVDVLPASWTTTSDALAAWVAFRWPADALVLLKSCPLTGPSIPDADGAAPDWAAAARDGLVDPVLPHWAGRTRETRWIDFSST